MKNINDLIQENKDSRSDSDDFRVKMVVLKMKIKINSQAELQAD